MKTLNFIAIVLIVVSLMLITGCSNPSSDGINTTEEKNVSAKVPKMSLHEAAYFGNTTVINQHIEAGTNLNEKEELGGATPLISAVTFGRTEAAIALINGGADLNMKNREGSTALHIAAFFCRVEIVEALLNKGADVTVTNNYGSTPRESVLGPFENVKSIYDQISKDLGPLGLKLDYNHIENNRQVVAKMLENK